MSLLRSLRRTPNAVFSDLMTKRIRRRDGIQEKDSGRVLHWGYWEDWLRGAGKDFLNCSANIRWDSIGISIGDLELKIFENY